MHTHLHLQHLLLSKTVANHASRPKPTFAARTPTLPLARRLARGRHAPLAPSSAAGLVLGCSWVCCSFLLVVVSARPRSSSGDERLRLLAKSRRCYCPCYACSFADGQE